MELDVAFTLPCGRWWQDGLDITLTGAEHVVDAGQELATDGNVGLLLAESQQPTELRLPEGVLGLAGRNGTLDDDSAQVLVALACG